MSPVALSSELDSCNCGGRCCLRRGSRDDRADGAERDSRGDERGESEVGTAGHIVLL